MPCDKTWQTNAGQTMAVHDLCTIDGCSRPVRVRSRGWCGGHYERWRRHGDPSGGKRTVIFGDPIARFFACVRFDVPDCWIWTGLLTVDGYGRFIVSNRQGKAVHRWIYEFCVGPIPVGLEIDHLCRVRNCVNPDHLEPVSHAENVRRGAGSPQRHKTHCVRGHPYDAQNTIVDKRGWRACRACAPIYQQRYLAKKAAV